MSPQPSPRESQPTAVRVPVRSASGLGAVCLVAISLLAPPAIAHAHRGAKGKSVKVAGGTITLTLVPSVATEFTKAELLLAAVGPATGSGASVSMPITSGKLNTATGSGTVVAGGGAPSANGFTLTQTTKSLVVGPFELGGGTQQFSLSAPVSVTFGGPAKFGPGTGSNLTANVNGSTSPSGPFFTLKAPRKPTVKGSSIAIGNLPASLTAPAAEVLGSFRGVKFTSGEQLANISVNAKR
jgi:hypothetical protein